MATETLCPKSSIGGPSQAQWLKTLVDIGSRPVARLQHKLTLTL